MTRARFHRQAKPTVRPLRARWRTAGSGGLALVATACAPDLTATNVDETPPMDSAHMRHRSLGGGVFETVVDATDYERWIYLDFEGRAELTVVDRYSDVTWDLGFRRFEIITNSGISGSAGTLTFPLFQTALAAVEHAPPTSADGWRYDKLGQNKSEDDFANFDELAFHDWYDYDVDTHILTPRDTVYVVWTADDRYFKVQISNYYTDAGTPATLSFRWAEVPEAP